MLSLSEEDRRAILAAARQGVSYAAQNGRPGLAHSTEGIFAQPCGLFVSLHVSGKLRGCIGMVEARDTLGENLAQCSADAALHDPRFSPLRAKDLEHLEIEVSLLTPLYPLQPEEVEIGKHGLLVERDTRRGLLLPQVATEHHLSREQFLAETCFKAGLPRDAWKEPETRLYGFECVIVAEKATQREKPAT
jgi:AmmeMemoRadiSam system protein A